MTLSKKQVEQMLIEQANGRRLSPAEQMKLEQALANNPEARVFAQEIQEFDAALTAELNARWPKPMRQNKTPVLAAVAKKKRRQQMMNTVEFAARAAVLLVLLTGGFLVWLNQTDPEPQLAVNPVGDVSPGVLTPADSPDEQESNPTTIAPIAQQEPTALPPASSLQTGPNPLNTGGEPPLVTLSGVTISEQIILTDAFSDVEITGFGAVDVVQGTEFSLIVETDRAYLERVVARIDDQRLFLGNVYAEDGLRPPLRYQLTIPTIDHLRASGGARIQTGPLVADRLTVAVSGSGEVVIQSLDIDELSVDGTGGGRVVVLGSCTAPSVIQNLTGGAEFLAPACE